MAKKKINAIVNEIISAFNEHETELDPGSDILTFLNDTTLKDPELLNIPEYLTLIIDDDYPEALNSLARIENILGVTEAIQYEKALCNYRLNNFDDALTDITKALKLTETSKSGNLKGTILQQQGKYKDAIKEYTKVLKIEDHSYSYFRRGECNYQLKQYDEALKNYEKVYELTEKEPMQMYMAICMEELGRIDEAINHYFRLVHLTDEYGVISNYGLAKIYLDRKEYQLCIKHSSNAILINQNYGDAYYLRAQAKMQLGYNAQEDISKYSETAENEAPVQLLKMLSHLKEEDYHNILMTSVRLVGDPVNADLGLLAKGFTKYKKKDYRGALTNLNESIDLKDTVEARIVRAEIHVEMGNYDLANEDAHRALELEPEDSGAYYILGEVLYRSKKGDLGFQYLTKAINLGTEEGEAFYYRGLIYLSQEKVEEGLADLSMAGEYGYEEAYKKIEEYQDKGTVFHTNSKKKFDGVSELKIVQTIIEKDLKGKVPANETVSGTNKAKIKSIFEEKYKKNLSDNMLRSYLSKLGYSKERNK